MNFDVIYFANDVVMQGKKVMKKVLLVIVVIALMIVVAVFYQGKGGTQHTKDSEKIHTFSKKTLDIKEDTHTPEAIEDIGLDTLKTVYQNMYTETKKLPDCLKYASDKREAFACSKNIRELNMELSRAMGDIDDNNSIMSIDDFVWDEKNKNEMITEIEKGLDTMKETANCIKEIETIEEINDCLQENIE